ncbi:hypothetical protein, conserved [Eimeria necatrix]|uniref:Uncharacterized protein n=1 Tax=Eimeria necatrix TaxID=51315 RepID=U6MQD7_9EIME|nr:hypothetical protein, conserved [Eimeria necatrix]CDJ64674.1 hypothetical protein, conserved [Eimeria necatrix]
MLKGPVAYEATVVTRLKSAGAVVTSGVLPTTSTYTDGAQGRLEVTARPPIQRGVTWKAHASGSTSGNCVFSEQRQTGDARAGRGYRMGFSPSKGSVSLFGCFSAADVLRRDNTAAVASGNASPLLQASCGTPALWICGGDVAVLHQIFRVLKAADPCDLQTFRFYLEQAQTKTTSMNRRDIVVCPRVTCLQVTGNEESTAHLPLALERQELLERLQKLQQTQQKQKQSVGSCRNLAVACIAAETLQRASVGQALLQCCEAAGLLLRIGEGGTQEPFPSQRQPQRARQDSRHQGQQEDQEQQHNRCFRMNVLSERAKAFSLDVIRKILLGGVLLQDRGRTDLLRCARIAQQEIREHLDSFFTEADALLHFAETSEANLEQPLFVDCVSASEAVNVGVGPHTPTASPHGVAPKATPSLEPQTTFRGVHEQLLAVVTAAGFPCFVSADGWLLFGSRGSDEVVLKLAAALAKNVKRIVATSQKL